MAITPYCFTDRKAKDVCFFKLSNTQLDFSPLKVAFPLCCDTQSCIIKAEAFFAKNKTHLFLGRMKASCSES